MAMPIVLAIKRVARRALKNVSKTKMVVTTTIAVWRTAFARAVFVNPRAVRTAAVMVSYAAAMGAVVRVSRGVLRMSRTAMKFRPAQALTASVMD